jgi:hypothetical protein
MRIQQKAVHLVREDELLEFHTLLPKCARQRNSLAERYVAVIVAMNQQGRRASGFH